MTHEVSPELIAVVKKIGDGIQRTRPVVYVGSGIVFGLLLAGGLWYTATAAEGAQRAGSRRRKRRARRRQTRRRG